MQPALQVYGSVNKTKECIYQPDYFPFSPGKVINDGTFSVRMPGEAMLDAGIKAGDLLMVQNESNPQDGSIVVALINGNMIIRRYFLLNDKVCLSPENVDFPAIEAKKR